MKTRALLNFVRAGRLRFMLRAMQLSTSCYRLAWLAAATRRGVLARLAQRGASLDELTAEFAPGPGGREALEAWLGLGTRLGEIGHGPEGYALRGFLARQLARPEQDAMAAMLEEIATIHHALVLQTPDLLGRGERWALADLDGRLIARSSRVLEPIVNEAVDRLVQRSGPLRLLEVGAGSGTYIRRAAERNPELTALGLELEPAVADMANENLRAWGLCERASVEKGDIRDRTPECAFDLATLHNNIYYFAVDERIALLRHLRGFLVPGGRLLLTSGCRGGSPVMHALDIWSTATEGCGRLPDVEELKEQMSEAGLGSVQARRLMPGESFFAFTGVEAG